jgi:hypothetical protein
MQMSSVDGIKKSSEKTNVYPTESLAEIKRFFFKIVVGMALLGTISLFVKIVYLSDDSMPLCDKQSSQYIYRELGTGNLLIFDVNSGYFSNEHQVEKLHICPENDEYRCIMGGLVFAVPKQLPYTPERWNLNDYEFVLNKNEEIYILGRRLAVYRIERLDRNKNKTIWYYYSPLIGIVAFGYLVNLESQIYIVQSQCGILWES